MESQFIFVIIEVDQAEIGRLFLGCDIAPKLEQSLGNGRPGLAGDRVFHLISIAMFAVGYPPTEKKAFSQASKDGSKAVKEFGGNAAISSCNDGDGPRRRDTGATCYTGGGVGNTSREVSQQVIDGRTMRSWSRAPATRRAPMR